MGEVCLYPALSGQRYPSIHPVIASSGKALPVGEVRRNEACGQLVGCADSPSQPASYQRFGTQERDAGVGTGSTGVHCSGTISLVAGEAERPLASPLPPSGNGAV